MWCESFHCINLGSSPAKFELFVLEWMSFSVAKTETWSSSGDRMPEERQKRRGLSQTGEHRCMTRLIWRKKDNWSNIGSKLAVYFVITIITSYSPSRCLFDAITFYLYILFLRKSISSWVIYNAKSFRWIAMMYIISMQCYIVAGLTNLNMSYI